MKHFKPLSISSCFLCLAISGLSACVSDQSRQTEIASVYVDILRFRDAQRRSDSATVRFGIDSILSHHGLTADSYRQEFRSLAEDPSTLRPFFELVKERLEKTGSIPPEPASEPAVP